MYTSTIEPRLNHRLGTRLDCNVDYTKAINCQPCHICHTQWLWKWGLCWPLGNATHALQQENSSDRRMIVHYCKLYSCKRCVCRLSMSQYVSSRKQWFDDRVLSVTQTHASIPLNSEPSSLTRNLSQTKKVEKSGLQHNRAPLSMLLRCIIV